MNTSPALFLFGLGLAVSAFGQTPGSVDATFSADQTLNWTPQAVQSDGKVIVGRWPGNAIARLNPDGSYDRSFAPHGISFLQTADSVADGPITVVAPDGKILVGMSHGSLGLSNGAHTGLARLSSDGSVDPSFRYRASEFFSPGPKIIAVPDGSVLVDQVRIKPDGSVDEGFQPKFTGCGPDTWRFEAWQPDGRILLRVYSICGVSVVRLLAEGTPDPEFHTPTTDGDIASVQVLADKRILINGPFSALNGVNRSRLARLKPDGSLDESFVPTAQITIGGQTFSWKDVDEVGSAVVQSDGKTVVSVHLASAIPTPGWLVRLNSDGSWDPSFSFAPTTLCCPLDQVDLGTYSIKSLLYHPDGSLWITTVFNLKNDCCTTRREILRLHGDVPVVRLSVPPLVILENKVEVRLWSDAPDGRRIILEAAPSLAEAGWQPIATNALLNGAVVFTDAHATDFPQRFYRALLP